MGNELDELERGPQLQLLIYGEQRADHATARYDLRGEYQLSVRFSEAADIGGIDAGHRQHADGVDADVSIRWVWQSDGEGSERDDDDGWREWVDESPVEFEL
jgi:hypothetical protein